MLHLAQNSKMTLAQNSKMTLAQNSKMTLAQNSKITPSKTVFPAGRRDQNKNLRHPKHFGHGHEPAVVVLLLG